MTLVFYVGMQDGLMEKGQLRKLTQFIEFPGDAWFKLVGRSIWHIFYPSVMLSYIPYCKILNMLGTHSCTSCTGHMQICIAFSPLKITFDCKIPFGQNALFLICMRELGIGLWVSFMDSLSPWCCDHPSNYCVPGTLNSQRLVKCW